MSQQKEEEMMCWMEMDYSQGRHGAASAQNSDVFPSVCFLLKLRENILFFSSNILFYSVFSIVDIV